MKTAIIIVRVLMGLLFIFSSVVVLFNLVPQPELTGNNKIFVDGINASKYLLPLIKITELFCGLALVTGYFVPLATVVIAPVVINILFTHIFVSPEGLPVAVALLFANIFLAYANWDKYRPMLAAS
jgi:putative oxidoreductase